MALERAYVTLTLLALTLGPVYQIRLRIGPLATDYVDDRFVQVLFLSSYAVAGAILARSWRPGVMSRAILVPLWIFCGTAIVSTWWSIDHVRTFTLGVLMLGTAVFGVYLAQRFRSVEMLVMLFVALQVGVVMSAWAQNRDWPGTVDITGAWTGLYINRNSLGPVAALGIATGAGLIVILARPLSRGRLWAIAVLPVIIGFLVADVVLLNGSGSATPLFGLAAMALVIVAGSAARSLHARRGVDHRLAAGGVILVVAGAGALVVALKDQLLSAVGKSSTLESRTDIWAFVVDWIRVHPLRGYGWMAAWTDPVLQAEMFAKIQFPVPTAHNGFLEAVLGMGVIGGLALLAFLISSSWRVARMVVDEVDFASLWWAALFGYCLVVNLQESFIGANLLVWAMLVAVAVGLGSAHQARPSPSAPPRRGG